MLKRSILNYLKNQLGWRTSRKIVVFSIDDYGNVRVDSKAARTEMDKGGLKIGNRFDAFDALETRDDLELLFDILEANRAPSGSTPKFTAFSVPTNINFEEMRSANYKQPILETLDVTFQKRAALCPAAYEGTWNVWHEGIDRRLIHPEYHGSQHFNLKVFREKLEARDPAVLCALENNSYTSITDSGYPTISPMAACEFWDSAENEEIEEQMREGLLKFKKVFRFEATHFNPPGGRESSVIHGLLAELGVKYIDLPLLAKEPLGHDRYKYTLNYTGKRTPEGLTCLVRNVVFEPNDDRSFDWVDFTMAQVAAAFRNGKPAIISSHRVNFCGHISAKNRGKGLSALKQLLGKIKTTYPDVEFMFAQELGELIRE